ncbi:hypothetical protein QJS10_CPA08g01000 [Acorus calamus]|uniref:Reverse transcriptase zinc-binding domain-containing protein n=1 Tax=Acorus calamus TaxID=4465 RepID=A0AAV9E9V5_ACOCL|nr:hypothetical protein QJS10_CPA08g01000 [Acorus calamus]
MKRYGIPRGSHTPRLPRNASALIKGWFHNQEDLSRTLRWEVNDGRQTLFWKDRWCGDDELMTRFPTLFRIAEMQDCSVAECWDGTTAAGAWRIRLHRDIQPEERCQAEVLLGTLRTITLSESSSDQVRWQIDPARDYSARTGYRQPVHSAQTNALLIRKLTEIWRPQIPLKIKAFLWLAYQGRVLTKCYRAKWAQNSSTTCVLCSLGEESVDHLFCSCSVATMFWDTVSRVTSTTLHYQSLEELWQSASQLTNKKDRSVVAEVRRCFVPAGLWAIWKARNALIFRGQRFYFENLWDTFTGLVGDWGRTLGGAQRVEFMSDGLRVSV